jgi:MFS family permease
MPLVLPPYGDYTRPSVAWGVVIVACIVNFLDLFQSSMVMFGLSDIQKDLKFDNSDLNWILVAYTLTFATILPVGGQLADRAGLRLTFLIVLLHCSGRIFSSLGPPIEMVYSLVEPWRVSGLP